MGTELESELERLGLNERKWIHTDKIHAKNKRLYTKIRRSVEWRNYQLGLKLLIMGFKNRPDFDVFFDDQWLLKYLVEKPYKFNYYAKIYWNFFYQEVFDQHLKDQYQEARDACFTI